MTNNKPKLNKEGRNKQREIKFRYYLKDIEGGIYTEELTLEKIEDGWARDFYKIIARVQYTGLKDKNGKEIYEGDIVKFYQCRDKKGGVWFSYYRDYREWWGVVGFEKGRFTILKSKYIKKTNIEEKESDNWEVIGNIFENSELLNKTYDQKPTKTK
jgi:hypothetical protein